VSTGERPIYLRQGSSAASTSRWSLRPIPCSSKELYDRRDFEAALCDQKRCVEARLLGLPGLSAPTADANHNLPASRPVPNLTSHTITLAITGTEVHPVD